MNRDGWRGTLLWWGMALAWMLAGCVAPLPPSAAFIPTPMPHPTVFWADFAQAHASELAQAHAVDGETASTQATGGLAGIYVGHASLAGANGTQCRRLLRFYPDNTLVTLRECTRAMHTVADVPTLVARLNRENAELIQGDYIVTGSQAEGQTLLVRLVAYDVVERSPVLHVEQGVVCGDRLVLQPLDSTPAPMGSVPVGFYTRLSDEGTGSAVSCRLPVWEFARQMGIALAGNNTEYIIRTEPGVTCVLTYFPPQAATGDERAGQSVAGEAVAGEEIPGTGAIVADDAGICQWLWPVGPVAGIGTVIVEVGPVRQAYALHVNATRATPTP